MVQINYGAKDGKGYLEILSNTMDFNLEQTEISDTRDWLSVIGIDLSVRTKDRLDFSRLALFLIPEMGLEGWIQFLLELKAVGVVVSNDATISLQEGYSAERLEQASQCWLQIN